MYKYFIQNESGEPKYHVSYLLICFVWNNLNFYYFKLKNKRFSCYFSVCFNNTLSYLSHCTISFNTDFFRFRRQKCLSNFGRLIKLVAVFYAYACYVYALKFSRACHDYFKLEISAQHFFSS